MGRILNIYAVIALSLFTLGLLYFPIGKLSVGNWLLLRKGPKAPDFSRFAPSRTLSSKEFPINDDKKRVIIVGDIHGQDRYLQALLTKANYNGAHDVFVHVGDLVSKGPINGSLAVLDFMSSNHILGVRGNHDQKVIEWRSWIEWIKSLPGGQQFLDRTYQSWLTAQARGETNLPHWLRKQERKHRRNKWWSKIPGSGGAWVLFGEHYMIAQELTPAHFDYLLALPLTLHVPSTHTFIVHAGLLSSNPCYNSYNRRQPLARVPPLPVFSDPEASENLKKLNKTISELRFAQEVAVLTDVKQNQKPWNLQNMRDIKDNCKITRLMEGSPWADLWNRENGLCDGFDPNAHVHNDISRRSLPCYPSTVIYGHAAARGLDVNRFSIGLDSGCGYNRHLTALVLGGRSKAFHDSQDIEQDVLISQSTTVIPYGDAGKGRLLSVACH